MRFGKSIKEVDTMNTKVCAQIEHMEGMLRLLEKTIKDYGRMLVDELMRKAVQYMTTMVLILERCKKGPATA